MKKVTETVRELALPVVEEQGCKLWDVEYVRERQPGSPPPRRRQGSEYGPAHHIDVPPIPLHMLFLHRIARKRRVIGFLAQCEQ